MDDKISITLSALGPTIEQQVKDAGLQHTGETRLETLDKIFHGVTIAHIHGVLTDSETIRAHTRIIRKLKLAPAPPVGDEK